MPSAVPDLRLLPFKDQYLIYGNLSILRSSHLTSAINDKSATCLPRAWQSGYGSLMSFAVNPLSKAPSSFEDPTNIELTEETLPRISSGVFN